MAIRSELRQGIEFELNRAMGTPLAFNISIFAGLLRSRPANMRHSGTTEREL